MPLPLRQILQSVGHSLKELADRRPDIFSLGRGDLEKATGKTPLERIQNKWSTPHQPLELDIGTYLGPDTLTVEAPNARRTHRKGNRPATMVSYNTGRESAVMPGRMEYDVDAISASAPGHSGVGIQMYYPTWDVLGDLDAVNVTSGLTGDNLVRKPAALQSYLMRGQYGDHVLGHPDLLFGQSPSGLNQELRRFLRARDAEFGHSIDGYNDGVAAQFRRMDPEERIAALGLTLRDRLFDRVDDAVRQVESNRLLAKRSTETGEIFPALSPGERDGLLDVLGPDPRERLAWRLDQPAFNDTLTPALDNDASYLLGDRLKMGIRSRRRGLMEDWLLRRAEDGSPVSPGQLIDYYDKHPEFFRGLYYAGGGLVKLRKCACGCGGIGGCRK